MRRQILIHPDPRLKKACETVTEFGPELRALAKDMLETMYDAPGLGLAAPQVGVLKRVFVMDCARTEEGEKPEPMVVINPEILEFSEETWEREEGCLSLPQVFLPLTRPSDIRVRYQDETGAEHVREFDALWSRCFQHEKDHLDGKLFVDYISATRRAMITQKMKRLKRDISRDPSRYPYSEPAGLRSAG